VLLALCLLVGAAGGLLCWQPWHGQELAPPSPTGASGAAGAGDPVAPAALAASGTEADDAGAEPAGNELDVDDGDATLRTAVAASTRGSPRVQVTRGDPPQPVAEAVVWFVTDEEAERRLGGDRDRLPRGSWPERVGQRTRTDAEGLAQLPRANANLLVAASAGGEFGFLVVPPRERTFPLPLVTDETLTLRTTYDGTESAAAIPLAVLQRHGDQEARVIWQGDSDRTGRVVLPHFQLLREAQTQKRDAPPPAEQFAALALVPTAVAVLFAGRPAATTEIQVPVPPLGQVAVQVVDHRGTPLLSPAQVGFHFDRRDGIAPPTQPLPFPRGLQQQRRDKPVGDAVVLLPFRELGTPLRVYARFPHDRQSAVGGPFAGPTRPGERVAVQVAASPTQVVLAGRLLLADGTAAEPEPGSALEVPAALWRADRDVATVTVHTVADGRFDLVLPQRTDADDFWLELRLSRPSKPAAMPADGEPAAAPPPPLRLGARVGIPGLRGGNRIELGDIVLLPLPMLAQGIVVDDRGEGVAGAEVQLQQREPPQPERDPETYRSLPLFRTETAADGTFVVEGMLPPGQLRLRADSDRHFADAVPLSRAGQSVRIVIARNGILRGRVLLPDWLPDGALSLQLVPLDPTNRQRDTRSIELSRRGGGRFTIEPLRPGRFDANVMLRNVPEPLLVIGDVYVQPGDTRDARLRPLDLRQALHRYRLRAVDQAGQPLALDGPILGRVQTATGQPTESAFRWRQGRAELITPSVTADLTFFGRGLRTTRLVLGPGDHDVALATLRPVLVELPGLRSLCGPQRKVRISAILNGDTGLPASLGGIDQRTGERFGFARWDLGRTSGGWLGGSDTIEIPLLASGKYELLLRPHATDSERSPQSELRLGTFELDVENGSWQPVRVPIDAVAVGTLLQQLDQRFAAAQAQPNGGNQNRGDRRGR
jgi:hypothetical protein